MIDRAFDVFAEDLHRPPPLTLRGANDVDSYDTPTAFDPSADSVTDAYLERHAFWALPHLDPQSWRHYLPWLMKYALERPNDPAMVAEALVRSLRPPDRFPPRLGSLTAAQETVVREFLETIALAEMDAALQAEAQQALEEWWLPHPRSRATAGELAAMRGVPITFRCVREDGYRLEVPDTLAASGLRDLPTESRRVQTWGGYVCGDVHMLVAVNSVSRTARSLDDTVARYATFFDPAPMLRPVEVGGARRGIRLDGVTPVVSSAGAERLVLIVAETGEIVTLTIRAAERDDVRAVMEQVAASFDVSSPRLEPSRR